MLTMLMDLAAIIVAFEASIRLRISLNTLFHAQISGDEVHQLAPPLGLILILWVAASPWVGLYRLRRGPAFLKGLGQVFEATGVLLVMTIVTVFFLKDIGTDFSRSMVIFFGFTVAGCMVVGRLFLQLLLRAAGERTLGAQRVLVVGAGEATRALIHRIERSARRSVSLTGVVTPTSAAGGGVLGNPVPIVGVLDELPILINRHAAERVIAVESDLSAEELQACIATCTRMGVPVSHTAGVVHQASTRVALTEIGTVRLVELRGIEFTRFQDLSKRLFDLAGASALLLLTSPLFIALALIVKLTSPGPVFYVASRVGRGGRYFRFFKFRSMIVDAEARRQALAGQNEAGGHLFKISDDPRITAVGHFMRRFSLDELPQLLNVLLGDMSLVGPRPLPAGDLDPDGMSQEHRAWASIRSKVRPGITGLWQVRGRSDVRFQEMIRYDISYVRRWSLRLDLRILLETIPAVLGGKGAC
jgi:exopolysaccharide biosynthesis polyprenyl glycosylphosphotransferase